MDEKFMFTFGLVKQNVIRMLNDRGYSIEVPKESAMETFACIYKEAKQKNISLAEAASIFLPSMTVIFLDRNYDFAKRKDKMISTDQLKVVPPDATIIVSPFKLSPKAKKVFVNDAQVFCFDDLIYDIPRHKLYMPHTQITYETLRKMTKAKPDELPKLLRTDAVVRWYGFESEAIIQIDRPEGIIFRCVE